MKTTQKKNLFFAAVLIISVAFCIPVSAATKKKIESVSITVSGTIKPGTPIGEEEISVSCSGSNSVVESYEPVTEGFEWPGGVEPQIKITLKVADPDNYYYAITKASQLKLKGCTYVTASRQESSTVLVVTVKLPKTANTAEEVEEISLEESGYCTWTPSAEDECGGYELRVSCLGSSGSQSVKVGPEVTEYNISDMFTRKGEYRVRIRAFLKEDPNALSDWTISNTIEISAEKAKALKMQAEEEQSRGEWQQDAAGWKFLLPDGTYPVNSWRKINGSWYYFLANSYAATNWQLVDGVWYYFDPLNCNMWFNCVTPDGYQLGFNGESMGKVQ